MSIFKKNKLFCIFGSSGSGKTTTLLNLLRERDNLWGAENSFDKCYLCYSVYQNAYDDELRKLFPEDNVKLHRGIPPEHDIINFLKESRHGLVIFDDLQSVLSSSPLAEKIATQLTHHAGFTTIFLFQSIFLPKANLSRILQQNSHYSIFMKSARLNHQLNTLASQLGLKDILKAAYADATFQKSYSYLVLDLCANTPVELQLFTNIFSRERPIICYVPFTH